MPTLLGMLGVGHSLPIMGSLYDRNLSVEANSFLSIERLEATLGPFVTEAIAQELKAHDHVLLAI